MSGEVRCLSRPGDVVRSPNGGGMPIGTSAAAIEARENIADFLSVLLPKPVWFSPQQLRKRDGDALETVTPAERIHLEIEMQSQARQMHSFDYDPLKVS